MREQKKFLATRRLRYLRLVAILAIVIGVGVTGRSGLAETIKPLTYTVNTHADTHDANLGDNICADASGMCSLRAAIEQANAYTSPPDVTDFHIVVPGGAPYVLSSAYGELNVTTDTAVHVEGATRGDTCSPGSGATIAPANSRAFYADGETNLSIRCITITGGNGTGTCLACSDTPTNGFGGAILTDGSLTLIGDNITGNTAGSTSTVNGAGGGVYQRGLDTGGDGNVQNSGECDRTALTVMDTTLRNNRALGTRTAYGGGLYDSCGYSTFTNSQFLGNRAGGLGASSSEPLTPDAEGGAIFNAEVETLDTVTLKNNRAVGSSNGAPVSAACRIADSDLNFNVRAVACGGAIYNADQQTLRQVTIESNTANATDTTTSGGHGSIAFGGGILTTEATNFPGESPNADPGGTSGDQSIGGLTSTVRYNTANATSTTGGYALAWGGGLFIGGHEFAAGGATVLVNGNTASANQTSLSPLGSPGGCRETSGSAYNGLTEAFGGGILITEELDMTHDTIGGNTATTTRKSSGGQSCVRGGGLFDWSGVEALTNVKVGSNSLTGFGTIDTDAASNGGGIYHYAGTLNLGNSGVTNNSAQGYGGGLYIVTDTLVSLSYDKIAGNRAGVDGGGYYAEHSPFESYTTVAGNSAPTCPDRAPCA